MYASYQAAWGGKPLKLNLDNIIATSEKTLSAEEEACLNDMMDETIAMYEQALEVGAG